MLSEIPYEVTVYTGDVDNAGTDAQIVMTVFGSEGTTSEITLEKGEERYVLLKTFDCISALDHII